MKGIKAIYMILIALLVLLLHESAFSLEQDIDTNNNDRYTYIDRIGAKCTISSGVATSSGTITPKNHMRTSVTTRLQKSSDGVSGWTTISTWYGSSTGGTSVATGEKMLSSGYYYRTYVVGKVYDTSGSVVETATKTTTNHYY